MRYELRPWSQFNTNPFKAIKDFESEFDRFLDTGRFPMPTQASEWSQFSPACEFQEKDEAYLLSFDLPGVPKEDINIDVRDNRLTISGERKSETKEGDYTERTFGRFQRTFTLPTGCNAENIEASYENGVLNLAIPKEASVGQKIDIKEGRGSFLGKLLGKSNSEKKH